MIRHLAHRVLIPWLRLSSRNSPDGIWETLTYFSCIAQAFGCRVGCESSRWGLARDLNNKCRILLQRIIQPCRFVRKFRKEKTQTQSGWKSVHGRGRKGGESVWRGKTCAKNEADGKKNKWKCTIYLSRLLVFLWLAAGFSDQQSVCHVLHLPTAVRWVQELLQEPKITWTDCVSRLG